MALRHPYSQTDCRMFYVVEMRRRKKARRSAMVPTRTTKSSKRTRESYTVLRAACLSRRTVKSPRK